jgi:class 3 adenylate cyclase
MRIKEIFIGMFFLIACLMYCSAQQHAIEITNSRDVWNIGQDIMVYTDESQNQTIQDILSPNIDKQFGRSEQAIPNIGITSAALWCKFIIENKTSQECYLKISNAAIEEISLFQINKDGYIEEKKTGCYLNFNQREVRNNHYLLKLYTTTSTPATFYLRVRHYRGTQLPIDVGTLKGFAESLHTIDFIQGIYFGFMLLMVLYNLFVYLSVRDKAYLYYVVYIATMALMNGSLAGYAFEYLWGNYAWVSRYEDLITASLGITGILFATNFLQTKQNMPRVHRIFIGFILLFFIGIAIVLSGQFMLGRIANELISFLLMLLIFGSAFALRRKGYKPAKYFLLACSVLMVGVIVFILKDFDVIPYSVLTVHSLQIGSAIEAMLFSFALADRINIYKKEKEAAQIESFNQLRENEKLILLQNVMLETKVEERTRELTTEKQKSDELLLNILPSKTAEELKTTGKAKAQRFEQVTVMFTDFKNFTQASEKLTPEELVEEINRCYSEFDTIITKYGVEKIKTIGDSYMCAGGLPIPNQTHAQDVVRAGLEMQEFIENYKQEQIQKGLTYFELRIGIHTGAVVAGIIGIKKFAYDIWGDTVNTASRMESSGEIGKVNISGTTYELIKNLFTCTYRGKIQAKNKGEIDMYFVESAIH